MLELLVLIAAGAAGAIAQEVAHWLVWLVSGRKSVLDLWRLQVRPTVGPRRTTPSDRVAATAPYVLGAVTLGVGVLESSWSAIFFGAFMIQLPSTGEIQTIFGKSEWRMDTGAGR